MQASTSSQCEFGHELTTYRVTTMSQITSSPSRMVSVMKMEENGRECAMEGRCLVATVGLITSDTLLFVAKKAESGCSATSSKTKTAIRRCS